MTDCKTGKARLDYSFMLIGHAGQMIGCKTQFGGYLRLFCSYIFLFCLFVYLRTEGGIKYEEIFQKRRAENRKQKVSQT